MSQPIKLTIARLEVGGKPKNFLVFDMEAFDWELSAVELSKAITFCGDSQDARKSLNGDIQNHFLGCLSEFLGREIDLEELLEAINTGELMRKEEACIS